MWLMMALQGCSSPMTCHLPWGRSRDQGAEPCGPQEHCATLWCTVPPWCPVRWEGSACTAPRWRCFLFPNPAYCTWRCCPRFQKWPIPMLTATSCQLRLPLLTSAGRGQPGLVRVTQGMGTPSSPVPCCAAVMAKALPSLVAASVLLLGPPGQGAALLPGCLLQPWLPDSFSSASIQSPL